MAGLLALGMLLQLQATSVRMPAPATAPTVVRAARATSGVVLDGDPSEAAWAAAIPFTHFTQSEPDENQPATMATEALVLYDDAAVYIAARLHDPAPDSITAQLTRRDGNSPSDLFAVFLDPYHDGRTGFLFGVSAGGTLYDGTLYNDEWDDDSWDGVWQAKIQRSPDGWTVEMRIPYSELRFNSSDRYTWGINFKRVIGRRNELDWAVFRPKGGSGFVSRFPALEGIEGVRPPRRLAFRPYVTGKASFTASQPGDPFNDGSSASGGVGTDIQAGFGSNLTLDATINPDFGQVEVDPAVVNLSDAETFYPEKRPFFLEGSNLFDFGYGGANNYWGFNFGSPTFFYSRRIGQAPQGALPDADFTDQPQTTTILGAAKLTGKIGPAWRLGTLSSLTAREYGSYAVSGTVGRAEIEPLAYFNVTRIQREYGEGFRGLGFIGTMALRDFSDPALRSQFNSGSYSLGVDGWTFLDHDRMWALTGWAGGSLIQGSPERMTDLQLSFPHYFGRPDARTVSVDSAATSMGGYGGRVALNKQRGGWKFNSALGVMSPGFDVNDVGFQFNANVLNGHIESGYWWNNPSKLFRTVRLDGAVFHSRDYDGNSTGAGLASFNSFRLLNYWNLFASVGANPNTTSIRRTRGGPAMLNPSGWYSNLELSTDDRKAVVFDGSFSTNQYSQGDQDSWSAGLGIQWKPSSRVSFSFEPTYEHSLTAAQYVTTVMDPTATGTYGGRYVFAHLDQHTVSANVRLNWIFTPSLSLEIFAQPLVGSGAYADYKELARPRTYEFNHYAETGTISSAPAGDGGVNYTVDPDGAGAAPEFSFHNPDFSLASLRGNAVLRWEFRPGSTLYLVWNRTNSDQNYTGEFSPGPSLGHLLTGTADNIFAVKLSYWWKP